MSNLTTKSANIRLVDADNKTVCIINGVSSNVSSDSAKAFAGAVETVHNNGPCKAEMRVVYNLND